ncbi:MAG: DinB family protein [Anaerolineae bacterium]|nr:DinB family protein [Anaerolineae bacterium]
MIDFTQLTQPEARMLDLARHVSVMDLAEATHRSLDTLLALIREATDAMIVHAPHDPHAHDPYAVAGEEHIGWTLGHLVAHTTATSEEWAAYSSILARGIVYPRQPRLRYETAWRDIDTQAKAIQRLEESRRMRLAYLHTWPERPQLDVLLELSERAQERWGDMNAPAAFLFGLRHEVSHHDQVRDALRQARLAQSPASTGG